jgi:16S rRNA (guanine1516-N2)-methyltransferase
MQPTFEEREVTVAAPEGSPESAAAHLFGLAIAPRNPADWQFVRTDSGLFLVAPEREGAMRLEVCAGQGRLARRLRSSRRSDPLPRAVGLGRKKNLPRVVDATAGLCRDAMSLAVLGCSVTAIERMPALAMFAHLVAAEAGLAARLTVVHADAVAWLGRTGPRPEVVYLDPMFSEQGRAQVKKEMQVCRALAGPPSDLVDLFAAARGAARERVVVKRHPHHAPLAAGVSFTVDGERVRFDVYLTPGA